MLGAEETGPALSVVIGALGPEESLAACLASLAPQRDGAEVLVCERLPSSHRLRDRFSWARFLECDGERVPHLWSEGIRQSRGGIVALTNSTMVPAEDWLAKLRAEQGERDVVGGAVEPGEDLPLATFAEYLCRYSPDMLPFQPHECESLPGDNASYKRELLERTRELYRDGFWEPVVHKQLASEGVLLWHSPDLVVRQSSSAGAAAFVTQRLAHGRAYGRQRGAIYDQLRNVAGALAAPVVPLVLTARIIRRVFAKRRHRGRSLLALPFILLFNAAWALGESRGHLDTLLGR